MYQQLCVRLNQSLYIVMVGALVVNAATLVPSHAHADIRVGVIAPLTGPRSDGGAYMKNAALLAQEILSKQFQTPIQIVLEDSAYEPQRAVRAFTKLTEIDRVSYVVGPYGSSEVLAVVPLAERSKVIVIAPGAQSDEISQAGEYIFRLIHNAAQEAPFFAPQVAARMRGGSLGILAIQTAFSPSYLRHFIPCFEATGKRVGAHYEFLAEELDFRPLLLKFKQAGIRDVLVLATPRQLGHVLQQAHQWGVDAQFFSFGVESPEIVQIAGDYANGLLYAYSYDEESQHSAGREFRSRYQQRFGHAADTLAANTFDGIALITKCITEAPPQGQPQASQASQASLVKDCLLKVQGYQGVSGTFSIDANGDAGKELFLKTIRSGKPTRVPLLRE